MKRAVTRRQFLLWSGAAFGAGVVACGGLAYFGTRDPEIEFIQSSFGEETNMHKKILVTYASKCGSTGEVAGAIAKQLSENGARVDVRPIKAVTNLADYRAVVIGSAIRMGSWLPEAVEFVKQYQTELNQMPTAIFTVHMLNRDESAESRKLREAYIAPVRALLKPAAEGFFAGKIDLARMSFLDRFISNVMQAKNEDLRDWSKIRAWAQELTPSFHLLAAR